MRAKNNGVIPQLRWCQRVLWMERSCYRVFLSLFSYCGNIVESILVGFPNGQKESCFLECPSLSRWYPNKSGKGGGDLESWRRWNYGGTSEKFEMGVKFDESFCKLVGFPTVKHEAQCMALFRLLEQDCIAVVNVGSSKGPVNSRQKGLRELIGLVSTFNYDGLSSKGRNKGSSNGLGGDYQF